MSLTNAQYENLKEIMENTWGDGEEVVDSMIEFIGDYHEIQSILENDRTFNRYTCDVSSWSDLAYAIAYDEAWTEEDINEDILYLRSNHDNEDLVKNVLINQNWCIDVNNDVAIGFDDDVEVKNHEVRD